MIEDLTKQNIKEIREILKERLENYQGSEHLKLDIEGYDLAKIIFDEKIDKLEFLKNILEGHSIDNSKEYATYSEFAIDFNLLKKLDLTGVPFFNVDVRGINFAGSKGVHISPQFVYLLDLSYTTLTDVKILSTFHDCKIIGTNFEGSICAEIEPQKVHSKNLSYAILKDVKIRGYIDGCITEGTIFDENLNIEDLYESKSRKIINNINKTFYNTCDNKIRNLEPKKKKRSKR